MRVRHAAILAALASVFALAACSKAPSSGSLSKGRAETGHQQALLQQSGKWRPVREPEGIEQIYDSAMDILFNRDVVGIRTEDLKKALLADRIKLADHCGNIEALIASADTAKVTTRIGVFYVVSSKSDPYSVQRIAFREDDGHCASLTRAGQVASYSITGWGGASSLLMAYDALELPEPVSSFPIDPSLPAQNQRAAGVLQLASLSANGSSSSSRDAAEKTNEERQSNEAPSGSLQWIGDALAFHAGDEQAARLASLSVHCPGGKDVTVAQFASYRNAQLASLKTNQHLILSSSEEGGAQLVKIEEVSRKENGEPLPGYPEIQSFTYFVDGPTARLISSDAIDKEDPLSFMRLHWDAVCWGALHAKAASSPPVG